MHDYKVSLIIPVYNVEKYLRKCLNSAIAQTLREIEIIIVNDGSTDQSLSIICEFEKKDKRIKVINQKNSGVSEARNAGLRVASGEFIAFLDSDDWIDSSFLEKMYQTAKEQNADIAVCSYASVVEGYGKMPTIKRSKSDLLSSTKALKKIISESGIRSYTWDKLYRRSLFTMNNISYPSVNCYEDMATTFKLFYYSKRIAILEDCLYYYLQRKTSITKKVDTKLVYDNIKALTMMREFLKSKGCLKKYMREYKYLCLKMMVYSVFSLIVLYEDKNKADKYKTIRVAIKEINSLMTLKRIKKSRDKVEVA